MLSDSILDLAKCPNLKTHTFTFMSFPVGELPNVQNWILKHFSHKVLYNYYYKSFFWAFWFIFNKVKKIISHCILNLARKGSGFFFLKLGSYFFCIYLLNSRGSPQSFDFDITYFISSQSVSQSKVTKSCRKLPNVAKNSQM